MQNFNRKTIIIGYSGHGLVVADAAIDCGYNLVAYCDLEKKVNNPFEIEYLGNEANLEPEYFSNDYQFIIGVGDNKIRTKIFNILISKKSIIVSIIHPDSSVSPNCEIHCGTFISRNSSINSFSQIGKNVIINTGSIIEHDCVISDDVHIAPGAVVLGNVKIGKGSFVGANSTIKEGLFIGKNVIIGAGSLALNDLADNSLFYGNPGKIIK